MHDNDRISIIADNERFLLALQEGPRYKSDLAALLGVSKKTVYRRMRELEGAGFVEKGPNGYLLTNVGKLQLRLYRHLNEQLVMISENSNLWGLIGADSLPPYYVFTNTEIYQAEQHDPYRPTEKVEYALQEAAVARVVLPVFSPGHVNLYSHSANTEIELVLHSNVTQRLIKGRSEEFLQLATESDVYRTNMDIPYGICVIGEPLERMVLLLYGKSNQICSAVTTTTTEAIKWAMEFYDLYRQQASRIREQRAPI